MKHCLNILIFLFFTFCGYSQTQPVLKEKPKAPKSLNKTKPKLPAFAELGELRIIHTPNIHTSDPYSLRPGEIARIAVQLSDITYTYKVDLIINLSYDSPTNTNLVIGPSTVIIPAGQYQSEFEVSAPLNIDKVTSVRINGWHNDINKKKSAFISVKPASEYCDNPLLQLLSSSEPIRQLRPITISLTISCPQPTPTEIQITSSNTNLIPPPPGNIITIPANATTGSYTTSVGAVATNTTVTLRAFLPSNPNNFSNNNYFVRSDFE